MNCSYDLANLVSLCGYSELWRFQCVRNSRLHPGGTVAGLAAGIGEGWSYLRRRITSASKIIFVDFCSAMCTCQQRRLNRDAAIPVEMRRENALSMVLPESSVDCIASAFGLKTLDTSRLKQLIAEMFRMLRPGGSCSMIEISVPRAAIPQAAYLPYIGRVIPWIGHVFLGNVEFYRMLGMYTKVFAPCQEVADLLREGGLRVEFNNHFFVCASSVLATKPEPSLP